MRVFFLAEIILVHLTSLILGHLSLLARALVERLLLVSVQFVCVNVLLCRTFAEWGTIAFVAFFTFLLFKLLCSRVSLLLILIVDRIDIPLRIDGVVLRLKRRDCCLCDLVLFAVTIVVVNG